MLTSRIQSTASFSKEIYQQAKELLIGLYALKGTTSWEERINFLFQNISCIDSLEEAEMIMLNMGEE